MLWIGVAAATATLLKLVDAKGPRNIGYKGTKAQSDMI